MKLTTSQESVSRTSTSISGDKTPSSATKIDNKPIPSTVVATSSQLSSAGVATFSAAGLVPVFPIATTSAGKIGLTK